METETRIFTLEDFNVLRKKQLLECVRKAFEKLFEKGKQNLIDYFDFTEKHADFFYENYSSIRLEIINKIYDAGADERELINKFGSLEVMKGYHFWKEDNFDARYSESFLISCLKLDFNNEFSLINWEVQLMETVNYLESKIKRNHEWQQINIRLKTKNN